MSYKTLFGAIVVAVIIILAYPAVLHLYNLVSSSPHIEISGVEMHKKQVSEELCDLNVTGTVNVSYPYELEKVDLKAYVKEEYVKKGGGSEKNTYSSFPYSIENSKGQYEINIDMEKIPTKCLYLRKADVKVESFKRKYF